MCSQQQHLAVCVQDEVLVALQITVCVVTTRFMSDYTQILWEWLQSLIWQQTDYASLPHEEANPSSRQKPDADALPRSPQHICSALSLSQWLPATSQSADAADRLTAYDGLTAYEVELTERSAFESFLQGYSLF